MNDATIRFPAELKKDLKTRAAQSGRTMEEIISEAYRAYIGKPAASGTTVKMMPSKAPQYDLLRTILEHGEKGDVEGITHSLRTFAEAIRSRQGVSKRGGQRE